MTWKTLSSKSVYKNKWMEVTEDLVKTNSGQKLTFGIVHKKPFALVVPWDGKNFYLVGQYRYAIGEFSWEFPQGHFEHNSINQTAKAELKEETGLEAKQIKEIGILNLAPGHHTQICHVFLATDLTQGIHNRENTEEGMKVKKLSLRDFKKLVDQNKIKDSPTIAAYALLKIKNFIK